MIDVITIILFVDFLISKTISIYKWFIKFDKAINTFNKKNDHPQPKR